MNSHICSPEGHVYIPNLETRRMCACYKLDPPDLYNIIIQAGFWHRLTCIFLRFTGAFVLIRTRYT